MVNSWILGLKWSSCQQLTGVRIHFVLMVSCWKLGFNRAVVSNWLESEHTLYLWSIVGSFDSIEQLSATDRSQNTLCTYGQLLGTWIQVGQLTATDRSHMILYTLYVWSIVRSLDSSRAVVSNWQESEYTLDIHVWLTAGILDSIRAVVSNLHFVHIVYCEIVLNNIDQVSRVPIKFEN